MSEFMINPAVGQAVAADPEIRPEAMQAVSTQASILVGWSQTPAAIAEAIKGIKSNRPDWVVPPSPPVAQPGSLEAIAAAFKARGTPGVGLSAIGQGYVHKAEDYRSPPPPVQASHQPPPPGVAGLVDMIKARVGQVGVGLKRIK